MSSQYGSIFAQDIDVICIDSSQHLSVAVLRTCRIVMLAIKTDFSIPIRFQPIVTAYRKLCRWQLSQNCLVILEKLRNTDPFFIMEFRRLCFVHLQEVAVIRMEVIDLRHWDKHICSYITNFSFYISFFISRIGITKTHLKSVVCMKTLKQLGFMDLVTDTVSNTCGIIKNQ